MAMIVLISNWLLGKQWGPVWNSIPLALGTYDTTPMSAKTGLNTPYTTSSTYPLNETTFPILLAQPTCSVRQHSLYYYYPNLLSPWDNIPYTTSPTYLLSETTFPILLPQPTRLTRQHSLYYYPNLLSPWDNIPYTTSPTYLLHETTFPILLAQPTCSMRQHSLYY